MNTLKKEVRAIKAKAKKAVGMTRKEAVAAIKKVYERTGKISQIEIALMNRSERTFVVLGYKPKTAVDYKRQQMAELSPEQIAGINAALDSGGKTLGAIARECNTTASHVAMLYAAKFKKTTHYVLKPVKGEPVCA